MGRLSGSPGPIRQTPSDTTGKHAKAVPKPLAPMPFKSCDQCGYAHDGAPISRATKRVLIGDNKLYLCNHHYNRHSFTFAAANHPVMTIYEVK